MVLQEYQVLQEMNDPQKFIMQAEEALKVSMFKWAPDHLAAGALFEKAGTGLRAKGDLPGSAKVLWMAMAVARTDFHLGL